MLRETPENAYSLKKEGAQRASDKMSRGQRHLDSAAQILRHFPQKASPERSELKQFSMLRTLHEISKALCNPGILPAHQPGANTYPALAETSLKGPQQHSRSSREEPHLSDGPIKIPLISGSHQEFDPDRTFLSLFMNAGKRRLGEQKHSLKSHLGDSSVP